MSRLVQSCTVSPIWPYKDSSSHRAIQPVQWSADSSSGLVLVTGRGFDHVIAFGPDHLAIGEVCNYSAMGHACQADCCAWLWLDLHVEHLWLLLVPQGMQCGCIVTQQARTGLCQVMGHCHIS